MAPGLKARYQSQMDKRVNANPLFVFGVYRSGTTMLREILNNHPDICIPPREYALYDFLENYDSYGELTDMEHFTSFHDNTTVMHSINLAKQYASNGDEKRYVVGLKEWYSRCRNFQLEAVLEALIRLHCEWVEPGSGTKRVWASRHQLMLITCRFW